MYKRTERLTIIAQILQQNNINPTKNNYAAFIQKIAVGYLQTTPTQARELTRSLTTAWYADHWQTILADTAEPEPIQAETQQLNNGFVTFKMAGNTDTTEATDQRAIVHAELAKIAASPPSEPIKKIEPCETAPQEKLSEQQLAKILYNNAKNDTFDGVGRIILSEARETLENPKLTIQDLYQFWAKHYPLIDADYKSNILLVYWEGKETMRSQRDLNRTVQPETPLIYSADNPAGDILEDDEGVVEAKE